MGMEWQIIAISLFRWLQGLCASFLEICFDNYCFRGFWLEATS